MGLRSHDPGRGAQYMRVRFAAVVLACTLSGSVALRAECIRIPLDHAKHGAHFVFEGVVTRAVVLSGGRNIADLDVARAWKGKVHRRVRLFYDVDNIDTQRFELGKRYVVFAPWFAFLDFTNLRRLTVDVPAPTCGWGVPYETVEAELSLLGRATKPL